MNSFDKLPRSIKKTLRYIKQDVKSIETLEMLEKTINSYIEKKRDELIKENKGNRG
ncbi:hypothetical protein JOC75_004324 [Metabacillus crassostreae]|uniref:LytR family transcriptional regulator n=1 Tax=Metabacillus crassostreae TaxID=929098 RepID=UPI0019567350|nr:LytR family transcriptional regulator [Metabacillus crassostreae]MBM7606276.1 hypothetical protein [Metabacillus crassostreae]